MSAKRPTFKQPNRAELPPQAEAWIQQGRGGDTAPVAQPEPEARKPKVKPARLTIDLDPVLHARFKAACAMHRTRMLDEVTHFIEQWTKEHS